eukprot:m.199071 g.199071  ORF g.199071 m.199071 type:complete len:215 (+) comp18774_c0_seq3:145-789(+)
MDTNSPNVTEGDVSTGAVVVIRHGERLDYTCRDAGVNWIPTTSEPWNPPLTRNGLHQAFSVGEMLHQHIEVHDLPRTFKHVYSSPLLRCVQTSAALIQGFESTSSAKANPTDTLAGPMRKVKVEHGLIESLNESWYRSWCLPASDSTWGFGGIGFQASSSEREAALEAINDDEVTVCVVYCVGGCSERSVGVMSEIKREKVCICVCAREGGSDR